MKSALTKQFIVFLVFLIPFSGGFCNNKIQSPLCRQSAIKFIANKNQWEKQVLFEAQLPFGKIFLEKNSFSYVVVDSKDLGCCHNHENSSDHSETDEDKNRMVHCYSLKMRFNGANPNPVIRGLKKCPEYYNYFIGNDSTHWSSEVPLFQDVNYSNLYPGISLGISSKSASLKYEYYVKPKADPGLINISYEGAESISIDNGRLRIRNSINDIFEEQPFAYQLLNGDTIKIPCNFILKNNRVSFEFPKGYNRDLMLIIDPVVMAATYAGTATGQTYGHTATYDKDGNIYIGGRSFGVGYPTTVGAYMVLYGGGLTDVAVSKLNPTGTTLMWATYLGGGETDYAHSLIVNDNNELFIYGSTNSYNFPVTTGCFQSAKGWDFDIFVTHLNASGSALKGSTFIGGQSIDGKNLIVYNYGDTYRGEIILDSFGNPWVASFSNSLDFPVSSNAYDQTFNGYEEAVVFHLDSNLTTLLNSTFIGGAVNDAAYGVKISSTGNIVVVGGTESADFPVTANCLYPSFLGADFDGFICVFSPDLSLLLSSTYFGTTSFDEVFFVQLDANDNVYVLGQTKGDMQISPGCYGNASSEHFITKLTPDLGSVIYQTVFGNGATGYPLSPTAFLVDVCENVYAAGWGRTNNFPVSPNAIQPTTDGQDFYLIVLRKDAVSMLYATYYGSPDAWEHVDGGTSRFDKKGIVYEAVCEGGPNFPTTPGAYMPNSLGIGWDLAVFKIDFQILGPEAIIGVNPGDTGCAPYNVSFVNNSTNAVSYLWNFGDGSSLSNATAPNHTYSLPGTYTVHLIAIDSNSCIISDSAMLTLWVTGGLSINLGNDTTFCVSDSISLSAGISNANFTWSTGDSTQSIWTINSGTYWVSVDMDNCFASDTIQLTVLQHPVIDLGIDRLICKGDSVVLSSGHPGLLHLWSNGATGTQITVSDSGLYYVVVDTLGCTGSDSMYINVETLELNLPADTLICFGDTLLLNAALPGCYYNWNTGDTSASITITVPGLYIVQLHDSICNTRDSSRVSHPDLLNLPESLDLCGKESVTILSNISGSSYLWSNNEVSQEIEISLAGIYILEILQGNCVQWDTTIVSGESGLSEAEFPNVFTPNSDGKNDVFKPSGLEITSLEMLIFNRWGKLIFKTTETDGSWDGKNNGLIVPEGVYFYIAKYSTICSDGDISKKTGSVTVFW